MKLLNAVVIASCVLQVAARLHSRDVFRAEQSDLCEHDACIDDNASPDTLLFRRKGPVKVYGTDRDGAGGAGNKDNGNDSGSDSSGSDGRGSQGTGSSSDSSLLRDKHDFKEGSQEERLKNALNRVNIPKKKDELPRKFDDADDEVLLFLEARKNEPDDLYEATPNYGEATIKERGLKVLQPGQTRSKDFQDKVDAKISKNYVVQSEAINPRGGTYAKEDGKYAKLFTGRGIAQDKIQRVMIHSKDAPGNKWDDATAIYYVDNDMRLLVCAEAFAARDTNAYVKATLGEKVVRSPNANENAVLHSDMMWAILTKVGGAQTSTKVGNIKEVIQHDVVNLGTVLTLFRLSKTENRAASDVRPFKLAEHPEWAGTANVSPTLFLKKDHPEVAGSSKPTEVWTRFVKNKDTSEYDLILSTMFKND